nr:hypothetical protein B0A51_01584 [Rachicladosporium sp. CCFEE 5018]
MGSPADVVKQLSSARDICLRDPSIYPQVIPGVLPVVGRATPVEQRRWGADFLAEAFASPVFSAEQKEKVIGSSSVMSTLKSYLCRKLELGQEEDPAVVKSAVQCAASVYPLVFRHVMNTSDEEMWGTMGAIKSSILRRMDAGPAGVQICCVKFAAIVVQVQTAGLVADPRRQEQNEISLALVPSEHSVLKVGNLEAEASGLLDRLMFVLQENSVDALLVTATLNALATIVQRRPSVGSKILGTVLNFNPLKLASGTASGKDKVAVRSMTRTKMSFLLNAIKRNPQNNLAGRIMQHVDRLRALLAQAFTETKQLKRPASDEPTDDLDDVKRQRIEGATVNGMSNAQHAPPIPTYIPPGSTLAQLFTLSNDRAVTSFHVEQIPLPYVAQLVPPLLASIDPAKFVAATKIISERLLNLSRPPPPDARSAARGILGDDEDDYDPASAFQEGDVEQVMNRLDQMPPEDIAGPGIAIGPFKLPAPPPMDDFEKEEYTKTALVRVFSTLRDLDEEAKAKPGKKAEVSKGFARSASTAHDRDHWITLLTRIATRAPFGLTDDSPDAKQENGDRSLIKAPPHNLSSRIRETLLSYIMEDFRRRINVAIAWLSEEWYCDTLAYRAAHPPEASNGTGNATPPPEEQTPTYTLLTLRLLDSLIPYLDTKDNKILIRLLSEIPSLPAGIFPRIERVADDPERVGLVVQALLYLVMFRPPVRELALDSLESLWRSKEDARALAGKHLGKWRPDVVNAGLGGEAKAEANGEVGREVKREEAT